ncbi:hypothetical protein [Henriciella sp.]|uniref:hypothetical protein n=1 Tax=Henriciella sp. TaxID=1968823 RepID=UPI002607ECE3|nr:hypothetical protein [Henriciella sp.]
MLRWVPICFAAAWALPASASPWARGDSELYSRLALSRHNVEGLSGTRIDAYSEYGLTEDWTVTGKYEGLYFDRFGEFNRDGWRVTARRGFHIAEGVVASLEGGMLQGEAIGGAAGCDAFGAEARIGVGQSSQLGGKTKMDIFWFAEGALRAHDDDCMRERLEIGFGQRVYQDVWLVSQAWFDQGDQNAASSKYQLEYLWKAQGFDVSAGTMLEFGGEFDESAFFISFAKTF